MKKISLSLPLARSTLVPGVSRTGWVGSVSTVVFYTLGNYISPSLLLWWLCPDIAHFLVLLVTAVSRWATVCWPHLHTTGHLPSDVTQPAPATGCGETMLETVFRVVQPPVLHIYSI